MQVDVAELDSAGQSRERRGTGCLGDVLGSVEDLEQPVGRSAGPRDLLSAETQDEKRLQEQEQVTREGDELPDGQRAPHDLHRTHPGHEPDADGPHREQQRERIGHRPADLEALGEQVAVGHVVASRLERLAGERANDAHAGDVLLQHRVEGAELDLQTAKHRSEAAHEDREHQCGRGYDREGQEGERRVHSEEQHDRATQHEYSGDGLDEPAAHEVAHLIDVGGHAGDELTRLRSVMVREAQPLQLVEDRVAHLIRRAMARLRREVALKEAGHTAEDGDRHETDSAGEDHLGVGLRDALIDDPTQDLRADQVGRGRREHREHAQDRVPTVVTNEPERSQETGRHAEWLLAG